MEMSRLTRDGTAEPISRDQILRHARGQGNMIFPCAADHEQGWQPYPVDPYSAICDDHTYIHTYIQGQYNPEGSSSDGCCLFRYHHAPNYVGLYLSTPAICTVDTCDTKLIGDVRVIVRTIYFSGLLE